MQEFLAASDDEQVCAIFIFSNFYDPTKWHMQIEECKIGNV